MVFKLIFEFGGLLLDMLRLMLVEWPFDQRFYYSLG
jgi:hypothetical protein